MDPVWDKDIMYLKKVGPVRAEALATSCHIRTYRDLLQYYPRKYVDRRTQTPIHSLSGNEAQVSLVGTITRIEKVTGKGGKPRLTAMFTDGSGFVELVWFQGIKYLTKRLVPGEEVAIFGKPNKYGGQITITHPEIESLDPAQHPTHTQNIVPLYPSNEKLSKVGLDAKGFRTIMAQLIEETGAAIGENLPVRTLSTCKLIGRTQALKNIHFPESPELLSLSLRRLKFEELFFFQLMLARKRAIHQNSRPGPVFGEVGTYFHRFYEDFLPFDLTGAQKRVLKEIRKDLARPIQMNRLVQGDVGSGKTMVAFMTMLIAKDNGYQAALMAPTAILAEQHFRKLSAYARPLGLGVSLLQGGQKKKEREEILTNLQAGRTDIAVGTHALIEEAVQFQRLGLVVVDEQHKFGVMQRAKLWQKAAPFPHNLIMTATPIPRTMAMSLYGDIDVSVIDELPPGRKPITTRWVGESRRLEVLGFIRREIEEGRQAYVVYPLVEESEKMDLLAATEGYSKLEKYFHPYRVGIVHGRMTPEAKELEMNRFLTRKTHVLVSTTVIEVGVDVSNASVMLIENAERFGLSQLHQLRGRVGRGAAKSYCLLLSGPKLSREGKARLKAMVDTQDGFKIAEIDLALRGPGDYLGTRQSGIPEFHLANIAEDQELLKEARQAAFDLIADDPDLSSHPHQATRKFLALFQQTQGKMGTFA